MSSDLVVVGLGNPGQRYAKTRHNVGFMVVDLLADCWNVGRWRQKHQALLAEIPSHEGRLFLLKPTTYMNNSGQSVAGLVGDLNLDLEHLCVVYDDVHLPLGALRVRRKGSHGGHNGMRSIIDRLGSQGFPRIRIGIGASDEDRIDHVLSTFDADEQPIIEQAVEEAADAVRVWTKQGVDAAMNLFNRKRDRDAPPEENAQPGTPDAGSGGPA